MVKQIILRRLKRISPMYCNHSVSIEEEQWQAEAWRRAQSSSEKRARKLIREWTQEIKPMPGKFKITDEMIARAKDYPIENLIDCNRGVATCISGEHVDKRPSMRIKNNHVKCWSCGYQDDSIGVASKVYGVSFTEAVRRLQ